MENAVKAHLQALVRECSPVQGRNLVREYLQARILGALQRPYTKGRDLYDLIWYLSAPDWPPPNLPLLNGALRQSGWDGADLTPDSWRAALRSRLDALDWGRAAADVGPFLERQEDMELVAKETALSLLG